MSRKTDKYGDKSYINAEALLSFDGLNDVVDTGVNYSVIGSRDDYSVEMIISLPTTPTETKPLFQHFIRTVNSNTSENGLLIAVDSSRRLFYIIARDNSNVYLAIETVPSIDFQFVLGQLYHIVFQEIGNEIRIYSNGVLIHSRSINTGTYNDGDPLLSIGGRENRPNTTDRYTNVDLGLTRIYNKALSQDEVLQVLKNPFAIPLSLEVNVVGEWIPQRSYYKDTGNIYGKGTNAILWFDSVEQYNDAKGSPLTANHGVLTGWTDSEVVTGPEPTDVLDFYDISTSLNWTDDAGATEIISGEEPIQNGLLFNGSTEEFEISGFFSNAICGYIVSGEFRYTTDNINTNSDFSVTNNGGTSITIRPLVSMYIFGFWHKTSGFSNVEIAQIQNNLQPRQIRGADINVNFNQESVSGELADSGGRTVTINHASPTFTDINTLR